MWDPGYRVRALGHGGVREDDHPLIVQFAASKLQDFVAAAMAAQALGADGCCLNLGCPKRRAREDTTAHT